MRLAPALGVGALFVGLRLEAPRRARWSTTATA